MPQLSIFPGGDGAVRQCRLTRTCWLSAALFCITTGLAAQEAGQEFAQPVVEQLQREFPPASIQSSEKSALAKTRVSTLQQQLEHDYALRQNVCYRKFFATRCLEQAAGQYRTAKQELTRVDQEASQFDRHLKAALKEGDLAEQRKAEAAKQPQRENAAAGHANKVEAHAGTQAERLNKQPERAKQAQEKHADTQQRINDRAAERRQKAEQAEENRRAYEEKMENAALKIEARNKRVSEQSNSKP
ncbi:MAG: hypothetical protein EPO06_01690 [Burkholderiaceae bacterium]|nr:MAG: hypothetical protein EPO06_01690 [Burkholderiaceae bacterium]